ncbi:tripartite tricarboxylate transporter substrate binding protein [Ramlibacter henchirensis]|uniref:Tripartite tricarboxylate transporter substrate binding protein n=1 Tax=Ramlibacter henchirensis TaxID=204072 RepID=A0A4Z0BQR7_9BURK|nr:tripartite tricarboxylate transporter substrate binding protein [Ramlibacter henchirensis]TFZ00578.1 tripartite tricarboxylate transporter substrate binding protein [Ramlibacter henchirensis]
MKRRDVLTRIAGAAAVAAAPVPLLAQGDKPITIIVPYAPGGTTDMLGRTLAREMAPLLGRTIVVDNKPGAGSGLGAAHVARSAPDGNTLLVATSTTLAINPWLYKKLQYDPQKDFAPIGMIGAVPLLVAVNPSVPAKNIGELIALSKSKPGTLSYGSAGNGSPQHLGVEMFKAATGADLTHVPYRGSAPAVTDLLGGQIQVMFSDIPPALQHVKTGRLRALAVTSAKRQPALQDVPTIAESGAPGTKDFEAVAWQSLVAPAGTPRELVDRYAQALAKVMNQPELRARFSADGFEPGTMMPQALAAYIRSESERWGKVVKASGATMD